MQQVITIGKDGTISGLQHKKGKGVDLRKFGVADIARASEIKWDGDKQKWFVLILTGVYAGQSMTRGLVDSHSRCANEVYGVVDTVGLEPECILYFIDYEDAVAAEIAFLNAVRVEGSVDA